MASVVLDEVSKEFEPDNPVVARFDLVVADGELVTIVGPSGCGKTTVLRMIGGLLEPTSGTIMIGGEPMAGVPPKDRNIALVFQENVIYPRMDVDHNVGFPLDVRRVPKEERDRRVRAEARVMALEEYLESDPKKLSAGYRHLVQVARALVRVPSVFLLDEPLAQLDAQQRFAMRREIALIQGGYGVTMIYVTNDQAEAMALGNRIVVMEHGEIRQVGSPRDVYRHPANLFVAGFVGTFPMNVFEARVRHESGVTRLEVGDARLPTWSPEAVRRTGAKVAVGVRPEDLDLAGGAPAEETLRMKVDSIEYVGGGYALHLGPARGGDAVPALTVTIDEPPPRLGETVPVHVRPDHLHIFDPASGEALHHPL